MAAPTTATKPSSPWDGEDDEGYAEDADEVVVPGATVTEVQDDEDEADEEKVEEVEEEAPASPPIAPAEDTVTEEAEEPKEDPDAWRNFRVTDDPGEMVRSLRDLSEKSTAVRRAIGTLAAQHARREWEPTVAEYRQKSTTLEKQNEALKLRLGNILFAPAEKARDQRFLDAMDKDRTFAATVNEWRQIRERYDSGNPDQGRLQITPVLINAAGEMDSVMESAALARVPAQISEEYQGWLEKTQAWAAEQMRTADDPYKIVRTVREDIDTFLRQVQNAGDTTGQSAGAAVAKRATAAAKPQIQVDRGTNSNIAKRAPESSPRTNGVGKSLKKLTESELAAYDEDEEGYERLLKRYGVEDSQQLRKNGWVAPG